ncbi:MAG: hypothetical protein JJLCMIEE_00009 [Acidimicrobiales bacterium]|nr:hypothetical protein [Acidimicrobiales bacterium]
MDRWATVWAFVHVLSWATYMGGALVMEFVWRPAQQHLPPSQTAVACQWMGRRYRWVALAALLGAGSSGAARLVAAGQISLSPPVFGDQLALSNGYGRTILATTVLWAVMLGTVGLLSLVAHPALHVRMRSDMTDEEREAARSAVMKAIRRMDIVLRVDLVLAAVAALLGASLSFGGIL